LLICDETLLKLIKRKHPKKGREKETRGKGQSPAKQASPNTMGHKEERKPLRKPNPPPVV
jgi:hypothetical protein